MEIIIILVLILLNGLFAMSEIALISARRSKLDLESRAGNAGARRALRLIENPDRFLSTIQIGITRRVRQPPRHRSSSSLRSPTSRSSSASWFPSASA